MLLKFKTSNYKSFLNEATLSMEQAPKQKDFEYSIIKKKVNTTTFKTLPTSVIYGPNASGKTNIIGAIETLFEIIKNGHIRNDDKIESHNVAKYNLELIPNLNLEKAQPTMFYIEFIMNDKHVIYELKIMLGFFLEKNYERKIVFEKLTIDNKIYFERNNNEVSNFISQKFIVQEGINKQNNFFKNIVARSVQNDELFLTNGYKNIIDNKLTNEIIEHLSSHFKIIYRADTVVWIPYEFKKNTILQDKELTKVLKTFGACGGDSVGYVSNEKQESSLVTIFDKKDEKISVNSDIFESLGTIRFANLFPIIASVLNKGGTLIVDELDASIHPMVLINIVNIFHNDEINTKGAQLIFNTHNPIFLNKAILRRDEIKFVEYEEEHKSSTIYSLSDFGTAGEQGVRKSEDYMKNYFISKYGAIKDVDFSDVFLKDSIDE